MRRFLLLLAVLACAISAWFFWRPVPAVDPSLVGEGAQAAPRSSVAATAPQEAAKSEATVETASVDQNVTLADVERLISDTASFKAKVEAVADRFLAKHGKSAVNFVALFTATDNSRYLDTALELYPNSPVVLMAALGRRADDPRRAEWIERFKSADSQNPLPWIYTAVDRFAAKQPEEAMAEMREALKRPGFYTFFNERAEASQKLVSEIGAPEIVAVAAGFYGQSADHFSAMSSSARNLRAWLEQEAAAGHADSIAGGTQLLYEYSRMMQNPEASRILIGQLVGVSMEKQAIELSKKLSVSLPNVDPEQRLAELQQIRDEFKDVSGISSNIPPQLMKEFLERTKKQGELATLRWLKTQISSMPVVPAPTSANR